MDEERLKRYYLFLEHFNIGMGSVEYEPAYLDNKEDAVEHYLKYIEEGLEEADIEDIKENLDEFCRWDGPDYYDFVFSSETPYLVSIEKIVDAIGPSPDYGSELYFETEKYITEEKEDYDRKYIYPVFGVELSDSTQSRLCYIVLSNTQIDPFECLAEAGYQPNAYGTKSTTDNWHNYFAFELSDPEVDIEYKWEYFLQRYLAVKIII